MDKHNAIVRKVFDMACVDVVLIFSAQYQGIIVLMEKIMFNSFRKLSTILFNGDLTSLFIPPQGDSYLMLFSISHHNSINI